MSRKAEAYNMFGKRLLAVANARGKGDTGALANAILENKNCREIVKIRERKEYKSPFDEVAAIKRNIQNHLTQDKYNEAWKVPSQYLYAYSIILDCSLDYLYGKTEIMSSDLGIRDICNKTGLSESAIVNLIDRHKDEIESDGFSFIEWWSELLYDLPFTAIPLAWLSYADRLVELRDIDKKIEACEKAAKDEPVNDSITELLMDDDNQKSLKIIKRDKEDSILGAHYKMVSIVEDLFNQYAEEWAKNQHPEHDELYYRNEINKRKTLNAALETQ